MTRCWEGRGLGAFVDWVGNGWHTRRPDWAPSPPRGSWLTTLRFIVLGREEIEAGVRVEVPHVVISIADPGSRRPVVATIGARRNVLHVRFHDAEPVEGLALPPAIRLLTPQQAAKIWRFVDRYRDTIGAVVVHCEQGMSRSPAVAAALCEALGGDPRPFFEKFAPNRHVYELVLRAARKAPKEV